MTRGFGGWQHRCRAACTRCFEALGLDLIRNQVETNALQGGDDRAARQDGGRALESRFGRRRRFLRAGPQTLLHGDPHIANTYLLPRGAGGFLDWQLVVKGRWAHDLTYLMITGLSTDERRAHERELIAFYLDALRRRGGRDAARADEAWLRYRQAAIWGLVIGWLITPTENYGEAITAANLARLVAAVEDLETLKALG